MTSLTGIQDETAAAHDRRLDAVRADLAAGRIRVLSVDIFDTLLWRKVPEPADAFLILGQELKAAGRLASEVAVIGFAELRRAAERAARERAEAATGYREITLADIYAGLPGNLFAADFGLDARIAAELACERKLLVLDHAIVRLMRDARNAGAKVILVSDTYFSTAHLRDFLDAAGFGDFSGIDRLYVSCEAGRPKWRDLFDTVLKDINVPPAQFFHIGDNHDADIAPARARQFGVLHYDKWSAIERVRKTEFPPALARRAELLGTRGDFGLTGLRSRLAHRAPADIGADLVPYWRIGATELAPVFAAFARWIVGVLAARGEKRVLGIMREGRFLKRLVDATAAAVRADIAAEEIWLSRRAVIGASLYADDLRSLPDLILVAPGETSDAVLAAIGLTRADIAAVLPVFDMATPGAHVTLARAIVETPALRGKVLGMSASNRRNLLRGLGQHFDPAQAGAVTLMDLGYAATIQTVLARVLKREGLRTELAGLYFALNDKAVANRPEANTAAFLDAQGYGDRLGLMLSRTPDVLEHAVMCREGSLSRYDDTGQPVLLANQRDDTQLAQMEALQAGILAGVTEINGLLGSLADTPRDCVPLKLQVARIVEAMLLHPTIDEANAIGAWQHEANFDLADRRRLTDLAFDPRVLEYRGLPALQDAARHQVYWPAGAYAQANPFLAEAFAAGASEGYAPAHLTSGPLLGGLTVAIDIGAGFDAKRGGIVPLAVNAFGRGEIKCIVKSFGAEACRSVKLSWPEAHAIIAVDHMAFVCIGENRSRTLALKTSQWWEATQISPGVQMTARTKAELVLTLETPPPFPHALEMTLRFKYLRLDPMFGGTS